MSKKGKYTRDKLNPIRVLLLSFKITSVLNKAPVELLKF
jgi:hypothetical protein